VAASGRKPYERPHVETESIFETLGAACTLMSANDDSACDPRWGGTELTWDSG
jgi:hypothetical protein